MDHKYEFAPEEEGNEDNKSFDLRVHDQERSFDLKLGTIVNNADAAFDMYNQYALTLGFSVRKGRIRYKHGTSIVCERTFCCSKEGFKQDEDPSVEKKDERVETRTGCNAHVRFKVQDGVWELDRLIAEHNHELIPPEQRHLLRSGRKMTETSKEIIDSMAAAGIRPMKAYRYLANEAGGVQNVGHTIRDQLNHLNAQKSKKLKAGDAQSLVNHFKRKQTENPMFFYAVQVDEKNRMKNFFWRDGLSKMDYECFGDVVVFDTTYRTNKYNMICAPFVGVNHHWKNVFFGCAFLSDETKATFVWLLETFRLAMGGKEPLSIFTDQDHAMKSAIRDVFLKTQHRLCIWHILKNAAHHISDLYSKAGFKAKFNKLFYTCESDLEFELVWNEMVEQWGVDNNKWLKGLYNIRNNWSPAFSNDTFSANIKSTQRSESTNNVFQKMACKTMTLTEFVNHYDKKVEEMRDAENSDDYSSNRGRPYMRVRCGIVEHAADVYTHKVFRMFQEEFLKGLSEQVVSHTNYTNDQNRSVYILRRESRQVLHTVEFNSWNNAIHCDCKMFEAKGLLCSHALRVLNLIGVQRIPEQYLLPRWTKQAKKGIMMEIFETAKVIKNPSRTIRLNKLMRKAFFVMNLSSEDDNTETIAAEHLDLILDQIGRYKIDSNATLNLNSHDCGDSPNVLSPGEIPILDPPCKRAKGEKNLRLRSSLEMNSKRKKKSSKNSAHVYCSTMSSMKEMSSSKSSLPNNAAITKTIYGDLTMQLQEGGRTENLQAQKCRTRLDLFESAERKE